MKLYHSFGCFILFKPAKITKVPSRQQKSLYGSFWSIRLLWFCEDAENDGVFPSRNTLSSVLETILVLYAYDLFSILLITLSYAGFISLYILRM